MPERGRRNARVYVSPAFPLGEYVRKNLKPREVLSKVTIALSTEGGSLAIRLLPNPWLRGTPGGMSRKGAWPRVYWDWLIGKRTT